MILRKPYAFLIKHFQKINLALFLLTVYVIFKNITFLNMVRDYVVVKYYNPIIDSMATYASFWLYLVLFAIIIICVVLIYLLYYKKKPVIVYGLIVAEYLAVMVIFMFAANYFNEIGFNIIDLQQAMLVRDVLFIITIPQYAILVVLAIRFLGLDLKKFGFREDEEYIDIMESDREEFEFEVALDSNMIKRTFNQKIRYIKYFILENKIVLLIVVGFILVIGSYCGYQYLIVENKTYKAGQIFQANSYSMKINKMYFTDKDFAGDIVNTEGRKYIVVDINIKNITSNAISIDTNKFIITASTRYYSPIKTHDYYFNDLGRGYQNEELKPNQENHYILIFEIKPEDFGSNYTLFYQEVLSNNKLKLREIKVNLNDITDYEEESNKIIGETLTIEPLSNNNTKITFKNYQLLEETNYLYTGCYVWDCRVYEGKLKASSFAGNKTILKINYQKETEDQTGLSLSNYMVKNAKITYILDGKNKTAMLKLPISREWKGNYVYFIVPKEIEEATDVKIEITSRNILYRYILKGGQPNAG